MNKFKFLTLSLVCAIVAFGYNNSATSAVINNDKVMHAINSRDTVNCSAREIAYQILYEILNCGIAEYPNNADKIIDYADKMIRRIINGVRSNNNGELCFNQHTTDYDPNNGYNKVEEENLTLWAQAESIFELLRIRTKNNNTLLLDVLDVLRNFSRNDMLQLLM